MSRANFSCRGKFYDDPELRYIPKRGTKDMWEVCNFILSIPTFDSRMSWVRIKFTAWGELCAAIIQNFKKGDWIGILEAVPTLDTRRCRKCGGIEPNSLSFTVRKLEGFEGYDASKFSVEYEGESGMEELTIEEEPNEGS